MRGLIYVATNASPRFGVPYSFTTLGLGRLFGVPNPALLFLAIALVLGFVLHRTRFDHYVYAVGGNAPAASEIGVDVAQVPSRRTCLCPRARRCPGSSSSGRPASATPQAALGHELTAIAAA